jgi:hypothetical protein
MCQSTLPTKEANQNCDAENDRKDGTGITPAILAGPDQSVGQSHQSSNGSRYAGQIEARALWSPKLGQEGRGGKKANEGDRHVD